MKKIYGTHHENGVVITGPKTKEYGPRKKIQKQDETLWFRDTTFEILRLKCNDVFRQDNKPRHTSKVARPCLQWEKMSEIFEREDSDRIYEYFRDKTIFLTGGSGFLGKVIIERLLRLFDVKQILVLIRHKRNKDAPGRLREIFANPLYDEVRKIKGVKIFEKCKAVTGNVEATDMDISTADRVLLTEQVECVIHSAATVKMGAPLKKAVTVNTKGTQQMLNLAKEMKKLQIFVYVSTAYCHTEVTELLEKVYPAPAVPKNVIETMGWLDDVQARAITPSLLKDYQNSYSFTKALAEDLVADEFDNLPVIIVRPSVVMPVWKGASPGWVDNVYGPTGTLIAVARGTLRSMRCNSKMKTNIIGADVVCDTMFGCMVYTVSNGSPQKVYNLCSNEKQPVTWGETLDNTVSIAQNEIPFDSTVWYPCYSTTTSKVLFQLNVLFCQLLPALVADAFLFCFGYKPFLWNFQRYTLLTLSIFDYYLNNEWTFSNHNVMHVRNWLNSKEKSIYVVDTDGLDYTEYFRICVSGYRRYILKEPDENLPRARRFMKLLYYIDKLCKYTPPILLATYLYYRYISLATVEI